MSQVLSQTTLSASISQIGYYHVKNLKNKKITSFQDYHDFVNFFIQSPEAGSTDPHKISRCIKFACNRIETNLVVRAPLQFSKKYAIWKGPYKIGLVVTPTTIDMPRKLAKQDKVFLVDLKSRTVKSYRTFYDISCRLNVSSALLSISCKTEKYFLSGRYFVMRDRDKANAFLEKYPSPIVRQYRRIEWIRIYNAITEKSKKFTSTNLAAQYYNLDVKILRDKISTLSTDFDSIVKVPGHKYLSFKVMFKT
jgi:hypothetical protein